jgi:hypothetical protein
MNEQTPSRERSTIEFPYGDLDDAVEVAKTVYRRGGNSCTADQLAAWLGHESVDSGTFRVKVSTARIFGLIETSRSGIVLTELGNDVVDALKERQARIAAFFCVPLYGKVYEAFRGRLLPPDSGLESMMVTFGVASKQRSRARQAFQRSAEQAGLFEQGKDRLVLPVSRPTREIEEQDVAVPSGGLPATTSRTSIAEHHPFIQGLLNELPPAGEAWPEDRRKAWLETAEHIFKLLYKVN